VAGILDLFQEAPKFATLVKGIQGGLREQAVFGLEGGARAFFVASLAQATGRAILVLTAAMDAAAALGGDLEAWLGEERALIFPPRDPFPYDVLAASPELVGQRAHALAALARRAPAQAALGNGTPTQGAARVVIAPAPALMGRLMPPGAFRAACLSCRRGALLDPAAAARHLAQAGYQPVDVVDGAGQFARRGGILDVAPVDGGPPLRLEFAGDEVESLRHFDLENQLSTGEVAEAFVPPAREFVAPPEDLEPGLGAIRRDLEAAVERLRRAGRAAEASRLKTRVEGHLAVLAAEPAPETLSSYAGYFFPPATLLDHLPPDAIVVVDDPVRVVDGLRGAEKDFSERSAEHLDQGALLANQVAALDANATWSGLRARQVVHLSTLARRPPDADLQGIADIAGRAAPAFFGQWRAFYEELLRWRGRGTFVVIAAATAERAARLARSLREDGVAAPHYPSLGAVPPRGEACVAHGALEAGFEVPSLQLAVVADAEVFGRPKRRRRAAIKGRPLAAYRDLKVGDFVVHSGHGVGCYLGIRPLEIEGVRRDYLFIRYAGADRLYVPIDQVEVVQKYVGAEGHEPRLNKLGGTEWSRAKGRVRESVRAMAQELIALYAARQALPGHPCGSDLPWQREFEDAFVYEETPDQERATEEIKRDMELARPMERLLCGDVGYGKTEVALRAAFKAIVGGKQAAILVPTTVLAHQHYRTCCERFQGFPLTINMLSRFRSPRDQAETVARLKSGAIDLVIGTHRLLQADVGFRDLGLLVIDEEHRFGVAHKERMKRLRQTVDCLILSATPIPRTLHMSLVGLRDMSVIETPPEDRYPVQTYVVEYQPDLVQEAIRRELQRGGQVYYVYNRVETIDAALRRLTRLVPEARIAVAHGQMREDRLERVMLQFLAREHDVLLCTTIIESGLDMANVNTLVVEDADRLGLSQLYQLRGRVGRSNRLAYAYFTYRKDKVLAEAAEKRLQAIHEFTELGSGFRIALRDLEIRGAGNLLGPEQHGFIVAVGFDMYCRLLDEAVAEFKGAPPVAEVPLPGLELAVDAYLPDSYLPDPRSKMEFYRKIAAARSVAAVSEVWDEMVDRCGALPASAVMLLRIARIRALGAEMGLESVVHRHDRLTFRFREGAVVPTERVAAWAQGYAGRLRFAGARAQQVTLSGVPTAGDRAAGHVEEVLQAWRGEPAGTATAGHGKNE
jgi:transcription-repair coupling factor (superfamily II helicase)